tara:strand:+ start:1734 stop:2210 length:477 start_codon:yes stop_codon:yes gene_type:complete
MIKKIEDNNVFEAIQLMDKYIKDGKSFGYDRNESIWIQYFLSLVEKQKEGSPHVLVIGDYTDDGKLRGFLSASTFSNYYNKEWVMDVKDCVVDLNYNNAFVVYRLFDAMIEHVRNHGGKHWRADSARSEQEAMEYGRFLQHRYNAELHISTRGVIQEN